jgi:hypothetical protein
VASVTQQAARLPARRIPFLPALSRAAAVWISALTLVFGLISLFYLLLTSSIATAGYDIQRLQAEQRDWELKNEQLQLELAKMQSLAWVEGRATQLGMRKPDRVVTVHVTLPPARNGGDDGR